MPTKKTLTKKQLQTQKAREIRDRNSTIRAKQKAEIAKHGSITSPSLILEKDIEDIAKRITEDILDADRAAILCDVQPSALTALRNGSYKLTAKANALIDRAEAELYARLLREASDKSNHIAPTLLKSIEDKNKIYSQMRYEIAAIYDVLAKNLDEEVFKKILIKLMELESGKLISEYDERLKSMGLIQ